MTKRNENLKINELYNKKSLINHLCETIEFVLKKYLNDEDIDSVNIRLQLVDDSFKIWIGDPQFDTDYRGSWGSYEICLKENDILIEAKSIAEEIVNEALDNLEMSNDY